MTVSKRPCWRSFGILAGAALLLSAGCGGPAPRRVQGYVEAEFVYVAAQYAGPLTSVYVKRGDKVKAGDLLFALDDAPEKALRDQAARTLAQALATWIDLTKAKRPPEIASAEALLMQAKAAFVASDRELRRQEMLAPKHATSQSDLDQARAARDRTRSAPTRLRCLRPASTVRWCASRISNARLDTRRASKWRLRSTAASACAAGSRRSRRVQTGRRRAFFSSPTTMAKAASSCRSAP